MSESGGRYAHITGWGAHVPARAVTNQDLSQILPTSDAWIQERTGIVERHIAEEGEYTSTMAIHAGRQALKIANLDPSVLDLVICATSTPDYLMPNTASLIQDGLGAGNAAAFDLNTACSGFVYAVSVAAGLIKGGLYERILVIGAESMSRVMNWSDRSTCVLFGDGAGAVVLEASDRPGGVLSSKLGSDGSGGDLLMVGLGTRLPITQDSVARGETAMKMNGQQVFRFATRIMSEATKEVTALAGLQLADIDLIVPHQANTRILEVAAKQLGFAPGRIYSNVHRYGNTSAASIPLALVDALSEGRIRAGDHIVFVGFGGGLTWGACLVEWSFGPQDRHWSASQRALRWIRDRLARVKGGLHALDRKLAAAGRGRRKGDDGGPWRGLGPGQP
ncbi:MAG: beta-ketoacyl-ACP synthase III [Anaerolineae bacterium]|nr:ketoacyl-ACP synthase III [Ardenticatenia bacterium]MBK8539886.1 ketoacyl-ACP synthase III [Ardenticatenia bacterium]